jgi:hypothetical protein
MNDSVHGNEKKAKRKLRKKNIFLVALRFEKTYLIRVFFTAYLPK